MAHAAIEFESVGDQLYLLYRPRDEDDRWVREKWARDERVVLKRTFSFAEQDLVDQASVVGDDEGDEIAGSWGTYPGYHLRFLVATADGEYFVFRPDVLDVGVPLLIAREAEPTWKWFIAEAQTSVMRVIARLKPSRIVIGGSAPDAIPVDEFYRLLAQFPTSTELLKYVSARVAGVVRQYSDATVDAVADLERFVNRKVRPVTPDIRGRVRDAEINKYELLLAHLREMLDAPVGTYSEADWQAEIAQIICLLNPKYIAAIPGVAIKDLKAGTGKRFLDILLVDVSGHVDVLEIKKPFDACIVTTTRYRDNFIPMRELSGTAMQVQKYLFHLERWGEEGEREITKRYESLLPPGFQIKITKPKGLVIMGRDNDLSDAQRLDFELIRRQYSDVVDIVTYDDLLRRLDTVLLQLRAGR